MNHILSKDNIQHQDGTIGVATANITTLHNASPLRHKPRHFLLSLKFQEADVSAVQQLVHLFQHQIFRDGKGKAFLLLPFPKKQGSEDVYRHFDRLHIYFPTV